MSLLVGDLPIEDLREEGPNESASETSPVDKLDFSHLPFTPSNPEGYPYNEVQEYAHGCFIVLDSLGLQSSVQHGCNQMLHIQREVVDRSCGSFKEYEATKVEIAAELFRPVASMSKEERDINTRWFQQFANFAEISAVLSGENTDRKIGGTFQDRILVMTAIIGFITRSNQRNVTEEEAVELDRKYHSYIENIMNLNINPGERKTFCEWLERNYSQKILKVREVELPQD